MKRDLGPVSIRFDKENGDKEIILSRARFKALSCRGQCRGRLKDSAASRRSFFLPPRQVASNLNRVPIRVHNESGQPPWRTPVQRPTGK
jgi:hypothetical protein